VNLQQYNYQCTGSSNSYYHCTGDWIWLSIFALVWLSAIHSSAEQQWAGTLCSS